MTDLKPCPLCGRDVSEPYWDDLDTADVHWIIRCGYCGLQMIEDDRNLVIAQWNKRVSEPDSQMQSIADPRHRLKRFTLKIGNRTPFAVYALNARSAVTKVLVEPDAVAIVREPDDDCGDFHLYRTNRVGKSEKIGTITEEKNDRGSLYPLQNRGEAEADGNRHRHSCEAQG